jgi:hypothetical protein
MGPPEQRGDRTMSDEYPGIPAAIWSLYTDWRVYAYLLVIVLSLFATTALTNSVPFAFLAGLYTFAIMEKIEARYGRPGGNS